MADHTGIDEHTYTTVVCGGFAGNTGVCWTLSAWPEAEEVNIVFACEEYPDPADDPFIEALCAIALKVIG